MGGRVVRMPIVMLSGPAGAGKDAVAEFMVKNHRAKRIAQADPMKVFVQKMFRFTDSQLWGPSELRNAPLTIPEWSIPIVGNTGSWEHHEKTLVGAFERHANAWLYDVLPGVSSTEFTRANGALFRWLETWGPGAERTETPRRILQTLGTDWGRKFSRNMWVDYALRKAREMLDAGECDLIVIPDGRFRNELLAVRAAGGSTVKIVSPGSGLNGEAAQHSSEIEQKSVPDSWFDVVLINDKSHGLENLEKTVGYAVTRGLREQLEEIPTVKFSDVYRPVWQGEV
jgi:hypothetical protein